MGGGKTERSRAGRRWRHGISCGRLSLVTVRFQATILGGWQTANVDLFRRRELLLEQYWR